MSLEIWVTLCDDFTDSSKNLLSVCTDRIMPHVECLYGYNIWYNIEFSISHKFKTTVTIN